MSNIYEDYKVYKDKFGLNQNVTDNGDEYGVSGNGLLYTTGYILALVDNNALNRDEVIRLLNVYQSCQVPGESGLYHRTPTKVKDYNSLDDIFGVLLASKYLDDGLMAKFIYSRGQMIVNEVDESEGLDHPVVKLSNKVFPLLKLLTLNKVKWNYNNVNPTKFRMNTWLGRRFDVVAVIQMAANKPVNFFYWIYWAITMLMIYTQDRKSNHNAFILRYTAARAVEGYGFMTNLVIKLFKKRFIKIWNSLGEVKAAYYNNPEHPDSIYLKNTK